MCLFGKASQTMPSLSSAESVSLDQSVFDHDGDQNGVEIPSDSIFKFPEALSEDEEDAVEEGAAAASKKNSGGKKRAPVNPKSSGGKAPRKPVALKVKNAESKPKSSSQPPPAPVQAPNKKRKASNQVPEERNSKKTASKIPSGESEQEEGNRSPVDIRTASDPAQDASQQQHAQEKKNPSTRKKRSPTARPHRRLDQEVVDFRVEKIESRVARLAKQMEVASKHLKAYKKEIEYRRLEQEEDSSSDAQC